MYAEWASHPVAQLVEEQRWSVLHKLPALSGRDVVVAVVTNLSPPVGGTAGDPTPLTSPKDVSWCMEVICYGLSLPLSHHEAVRDCVSIYCDWLQALTKPKPHVPRPVCQDPNNFARRIISHFYNLFVPRPEANSDLISKQALLCHRVLRTLKTVAEESNVLDRKTWDSLLLFLLGINDLLLSPAPLQDDIGTHLCERILSVLVQVWLVACHRSFPAPPLWKTLRELCCRWRHRMALVDQWNQVCLELTVRVLHILYGPDFMDFRTGETTNLVPVEMSRENVVETWFRFLHTLGNPVALCKPEVVSQAAAEDSVIDPSQHPAQLALPLIFHRAMKGVSQLVDAFLGRAHQQPVTGSLSKSSLTSMMEPFLSQSSGPTPLRPSTAPTVNSILHLFGGWLFQASLLEPEIPRPRTLTESLEGAPLPGPLEFTTSLGVEQFEAGQAEAAGALCRLVCSKRTGEEVLPVYLARFYWSVHCGLRTERRWQLLCSLLLNCPDLLRHDLAGVNTLLPDLLPALELVLMERDLPFLQEIQATELRHRNVHQMELRNAAIHLLLSLLPLPNHFCSLTVKGLDPGAEVVSFQSLWPRLIKLLIAALKSESDSYNTQMLLGGLLFSVLDSSLCQESPHSAELFTQAATIVHTHLLWAWKTDLNVCLAALEVLQGLARIHPQHHGGDQSYGSSAVRGICDFIVWQCSRPPQAHSRDLHSSIVASYQVLTVWLLEHPSLLSLPECVATLLEVVELGISGSKSQAAPFEPPKFKAEKEMKPASMRVKDAAEGVLAAMLQHVDHFPSPCGPATLSSLLDEQLLLKHLARDPPDWEQAVLHFRYFLLNRSILLAVYEHQPSQEPLPTVTMLLRGPFGRYAWTLQLRHLPRSKSGPPHTYTNPGRPLPCPDVGIIHSIRHRYFPDSVERIPQCSLDRSIPPLPPISKEHHKIAGLLDRQVKYEESLPPSSTSLQFPDPEIECQPPELRQEFQTARLALTHLGLLSPQFGAEEQLQPLNPRLDGFPELLQGLDRLPSRTTDTLYVYYVHRGQKSSDEILENTLSQKHVNPHFLEFLLSLGWPVSLDSHQGWNGNLRHNADPDTPQEVPSDHGGALYNGEQQILYWADGCSELAILVPSKQLSAEESEVTIRVRNYMAAGSKDPINSEQRGVPEEIDPRLMRFGRQPSLCLTTASRVLVVWLEKLEDHLVFPLGELMPFAGHDGGSSRSGSPFSIIFIHPLLSGLFLIKLVGPSFSRMALPLVDGMVVSRRCLGPLVRQTALNLCRRRRLDAEHHQPPHVRRRLKIQEIAARASHSEPRPDFLASFYHPTTTFQ